MLRTRCFLSILFLGVLASQAQAAAVGSSFSYQGELQNSGIQVDGAVDFRFTMHDASAGGTVIGTSLSMTNVTVSRGVFSVQLDFGANAFDGQERWLEIEVRDPHDPTDTLPFELLTPRQPVQPAPYALHALNSPWQTNGTAITNTNPGFVGINRDYVVGSEWFGVHAPIQSGYGGMYVSTEGDLGKPFYGYYAGTGQTGWHYVDGATGDWKLDLSGTRFTVTDEGNVGIGIGDAIPASKLEVNGVIHSKLGGVRFPDGTTQTTANTATGDGHSLDSPNGAFVDAVAVNNTGEFGVNVNLAVGKLDPFYRFEVEDVSTAANVVHIERVPASVGGADLIELELDSTSDPNAQFLEAQWNNGDVKLRVWADGDLSLDGVVTTGGADFAELVHVTTGKASVEAGDVVVIDPRSARGFVKSSAAHSRLVAGIYSTRPGLLGTETDWDLREVGADAEGNPRKAIDIAGDYDQIPLAVVGIVPCKVSAENGPVRAGDLLVTSATAGHAMRADDPKVGTIVGKALQDMTGKTDRITVLVTLQ